MQGEAVIQSRQTYWLLSPVSKSNVHEISICICSSNEMYFFRLWYAALSFITKHRKTSLSCPYLDTKNMHNPSL
jgi:hypothetical protein